MRTHTIIVGAVAIASIAIALAGCGGRSGAEGKPPAGVPVAVYQIDTGSASFFDVYPATVFALNQVDLRPQVSGYIVGIYVKDGQRVRKGTKLYAIDRQHYQAAYDQAVANLNTSRSNLAKMQQDVDRYNELAKNDAIARQTLDHAIADLESAKMQVAGLEANVKNVQTDLRYSVIEAPFDGTISFSQVKVGSSVTAGQTLLNTISSDDPMAVDCNVDQKQIPRFAGMLAEKVVRHDTTFSIVLPDGSVYPEAGRLSVIDRAVDPQTGTIRVRVVVPNPREILKAGITCNLRIRSTSPVSSVLFPYRAVVEQMGEYFVFVLTGDKVVQRRVTLGARINDMVVSRGGLAPGDQIVVDGVQKLRDNTVVAVVPPQAKATTETAPAK